MYTILSNFNIIKYHSTPYIISDDDVVFFVSFVVVFDVCIVLVVVILLIISVVYNQTQVVVKRVARVISMLPKRLFKNNDLNVVRNCFDMRPYKTKSMAAFIKANKSIISPNGG